MRDRIEAARKAGFSDLEIAESIARHSGVSQDRIRVAFDRGFSSDEIFDSLLRNSGDSNQAEPDEEQERPGILARVAKGLGLGGREYDENEMGGQMITPDESRRNAAEYGKREKAAFEKDVAIPAIRAEALRMRGIDNPEDQAALVNEEIPEDEMQAARKRLGDSIYDRDLPTMVSDTATAIGSGVKQLASAPVQLVSPDGETARRMRAEIDETNAALSPQMQGQLELFSQNIKDAAEEGRWAEVQAAFSGLSPALVAHFTANTLPSMLPVIGAGKVAQIAAIARGAAPAGVMLAGARGAGAANAVLNAAIARGAAPAGVMLAGARGAGAANAVLNAGSVRGDAFQDLERVFIEQGMSPEEAKETALSESWLPTAVAAVTGYVGGRFGAESDIIGGAVAQAARGGVLPALKAAVGSLGRELGTEQLEELLPQMTTNLLAGRDALDGLAETAAQTVAGVAGPGTLGAASAAQRAYDPLGSELQGLPGEVERTQFSYADLARAQAQQAMDASAIMAKIGSAQSVDEAIAAASEAMAAPNTNLQETMNVAAQVAQGRAQEQGDLGAGGTGNNLDLRGLDGRGGADAGAPALGDRASGVVGNAGLADPTLINQQNDLDNLENDLFGVTDAAQAQPLAQEATQANGQETGSQQTTAPAGFENLTISTRPTGTIEVSGPSARELVTQIVPGESVQQRKDGSVIVGRKYAGAVQQAYASVAMPSTMPVSIQQGEANVGQSLPDMATDVGGATQDKGATLPGNAQAGIAELARHFDPGTGFARVAAGDIPARAGESEQVTAARRDEAALVEALFARAGTETVFVTAQDGRTRFGGVFLPDSPGRIFIDVNGKGAVQDAIRVRAAHEALHDLEERDPALFQRMALAVRKAGAAKLSQAEFQPIYDPTGNIKLQSSAHATSEQMANLFGNILYDPEAIREMLNRIDGVEPGAVAKVVAAIRNAIDRIKASIKSLGSKYDTSKYEGDLDRVRKVLMDGYVEFARAQGKTKLQAEVDLARAPKASPVKAPQETENREGVIVGARPGEFDWSFAKGGTPAPIQHPVQLAPRVEKLGPAVQKILSSKQAKQLFEDAFGVTGLQVMPTLGSYKGKPEPSFVMYGNGMTFDAADGMSRMLGFAFAQEATIVTQPVYSGDEDTWPAFYLSSGKKLTKQQIEKVREAAANEKLDYTTSVDMTAVKFFFDGSDLDAYQSKIVGIAKAAGLKNIDRVQTRSKFNEAANYLGGEAEGAGRQVWYQEGGSGSSSLFGRTVDHLLVPYAKAVGAEGYRFSPDLFADRFGLSPQQREYVRAALRPKNGAKLSTADIVAGRETLEVTKSDFRAKTPRSNNTDILWALQNRAAKNGQIEPGDYSDDAKKAISQALADEVVEHISRPGGKSAIGWYDAALKRAKEIYDRVFPELNTNKDREMLFDALLGIASQGNDVHSNSVFAGRMYHLITREGMTISQAVDALYGTFGGETRAIENNFLKFEALIDRNGYDRMRQLFNKKMTVGEWNALLRRDETLFYKGEPLKVEGAARQKVNGWMVFGPKIGSFINNLHGDYSTLTADLWFSRTWNRVLGFSFLHTPQQEADKYQSFKEALIAEHTKTTEPKGFDRAGKPIAWEHGEDINFTDAELDAILADPDEMLALANELNDWYKKGFTFSHDPKDKKGGYSTKSSLRRAAKTWIEHRQDSVAAPRNDNERAFQQETVEAAQKIIRRKTGEDISIADIQAALWYHEKELFQMFGAGDKKAEPADYADAAQNFMDRYDNGDLFYVEKPSPRYIRGKKGDYLDGNQGQRFSPRRSDVAGNERAGGSDAEAGSGVDLPEYGQAAPGAVSAVGRHYSAQQRSSLDGRYYGTGANGREAERLRTASDPRIKERIYFYVNSGKGITPEQGVGIHAHDIRLNNLYDANADTWLQARVDRGITDRNEWLNAFESAILDNGFDGYVSDFGTQRAAVLLGRHNVKPSYVGVNPTKTPGKAETQAAKPKAQTNADADKVASARALPLGQMTGADWKRIVPLVVPDVDVSMLDDAKTYYKDDVVSAMRAGQARMSPSRAAPSRDVINQAVDDDFTGIVARMKKAGVLTVECS